MSDLVSPFLVLMEDECEAFWCFAQFMETMGRNFNRDQTGMQNQLLSISKARTSPHPMALLAPCCPRRARLPVTPQPLLRPFEPDCTTFVRASGVGTGLVESLVECFQPRQHLPTTLAQQCFNLSHRTAWS